MRSFANVKKQAMVTPTAIPSSGPSPVAAGAAKLRLDKTLGMVTALAFAIVLC